MIAPRPARSPRRLLAASILPLALAVLAPASAHAQPYPDTDDLAPPPSTVAPPDENLVDTDPSALADFGPALAQYGTWVNDPRYGTVWVPSPGAVGPDFVPYRTGGHWELLPDGRWYWQSDYPWGQITFHYGRWAYLPGLGWSWVPGRRWAPAWVDWSVNGADDYVGWSPAPPTYYWSGGVALSWPAAWEVSPYWSYVPAQYAFNPYVSRYVVQQPWEVRRIAAGARVVPYWGVGRYAAPYYAGARVYRGEVGWRGYGYYGGHRPYVGGTEGYNYNTGRFVRGYGPTPRGYVGYAGPGGADRGHEAYEHGYVGRGGHANAYPATGGGAWVAGRHVAPTYAAPRSGAHYASPHYAAPHYAAPRSAAPHAATPHFAVPHSAAPHAAAPHFAAPHASAPHAAAVHSAPAASHGGGGHHR